MAGRSDVGYEYDKYEYMYSSIQVHVTAQAIQGNTNRGMGSNVYKKSGLRQIELSKGPRLCSVGFKCNYLR